MDHFLLDLLFNFFDALLRAFSLMQLFATGQCHMTLVKHDVTLAFDDDAAHLVSVELWESVESDPPIDTGSDRFVMRI